MFQESIMYMHLPITGLERTGKNVADSSLYISINRLLCNVCLQRCDITTWQIERIEFYGMYNFIPWTI